LVILAAARVWEGSGITARNAWPTDLLKKGHRMCAHGDSQGGKMRRRRRLFDVLLLVAACCAVLPASAQVLADAQHFYGPLRNRDLTPFGYLRLDMRPTFGGTLAPGTWALESEIGHQNTWALSPGVKHYLASLPGRRTLGPADLTAIRSLPGDNYLVDLELTQLDFTLHRQFAQDWGGFLILSGARYGGGFLDGAVEQFHSAFSLGDGSRPAVARRQTNIIFDLKSLQYTNLDADARAGLLDPTVGVRYSGAKLPLPWTLTFEVAAKVPVAGERRWLSSGRVDAGVQTTLVRRGPRHAVYANAALVQHAGSSGPLQADAQLLPTLVLALDSHLTRRTHSILQLYASPSVYTQRETDLEELRAPKYQLSIGLRHQRARHLFTFAVTENLGYLNNTPDIGVQLGWAYHPVP
jgi:hypothetical protein